MSEKGGHGPNIAAGRERLGGREVQTRTMNASKPATLIGAAENVVDIFQAVLA